MSKMQIPPQFLVGNDSLVNQSSNSHLTSNTAERDYNDLELLINNVMKDDNNKNNTSMSSASRDKSNSMISNPEVWMNQNQQDPQSFVENFTDLAIKKQNPEAYVDPKMLKGYNETKMKGNRNFVSKEQILKQQRHKQEIDEDFDDDEIEESVTISIPKRTTNFRDKNECYPNEINEQFANMNINPNNNIQMNNIPMQINKMNVVNQPNNIQVGIMTNTIPISPLNNIQMNPLENNNNNNVNNLNNMGMNQMPNNINNINNINNANIPMNNNNNLNPQINPINNMMVNPQMNLMNNYNNNNNNNNNNYVMNNTPQNYGVETKKKVNKFKNPKQTNIMPMTNTSKAIMNMNLKGQEMKPNTKMINKGKNNNYNLMNNNMPPQSNVMMQKYGNNQNNQPMPYQPGMDISNNPSNREYNFININGSARFTQNIYMNFPQGGNNQNLNPQGNNMNNNNNNNMMNMNMMNNNPQPNYNNNKINLDNIIIGADKRTTLMLRNIPNKYTLINIVDEIGSAFWGKYDCINLPIDYETKLNLGYAFINFTDPLHIVHFFTKFHLKKWSKYKSEKKMDMTYADKQGKKDITLKAENNYFPQDDKRFDFKMIKPLIEIPCSYLDFFKKLYPTAVCVTKDKSFYADGYFYVKSFGKNK